MSADSVLDLLIRLDKQSYLSVKSHRDYFKIVLTLKVTPRRKLKGNY